MNEVQVDDIVSGAKEVQSSRSLAMEVIFRKLISRIFETNPTLTAIALRPAERSMENYDFLAGCYVYTSAHPFTEEEITDFDSYLWNDDRFDLITDGGEDILDALGYFLGDLRNWYPVNSPIMFKSDGWDFVTKESEQ